ncbi:hypothetical protein BU23DRAFT_146678 [Bimuria novae-zelandiae CBS 107.79]|uniref:Uncharacterized protein n=1 Tax=Bimuria novae-zelandiae CBS 107.79 TaxID=1447943 RepID=A0A6A5VAB5_9PLEO|nr:hypothetical protein BU23DRAFT_146678 [Bimuria novae-zelandiae CBS 107.79]
MQQFLTAFNISQPRMSLASRRVKSLHTIDTSVPHQQPAYLHIFNVTSTRTVALRPRYKSCVPQHAVAETPQKHERPPKRVWGSNASPLPICMACPKATAAPILMCRAPCGDAAPCYTDGHRRRGRSPRGPRCIRRSSRCVWGYGMLCME